MPAISRPSWCAIAPLLLPLLLVASLGAQGMQRQATNPAQLASRPRQAGPQPPSWHPLTPEHAKYTNDILAYWEWRSNKIERYRCKFKRWEYDPVQVSDPRVFFRYSEGVIKYAAPDKGLFQVEATSQLVLPLVPGQNAKYKRLDETMNEHWVCDGKALYQFNGPTKQLIQRNLPPEMQGQQIAHGPLPFLFNAKADDIKRRYWVRALTPPPKQGTYHLEAVPRTPEDAVDFLKVHIIIAADQDCLPEGIVLYHRNKAKTTFGFEDREENWNVLIENINLFHREFYEPKPPAGWEKVVEPLEPASTPEQTPLRQTRLPQSPTAR
jgi:TIGR03009 family protein